MLEKIISGGQRGAEIAALRAAHTLKIPTGGTALPDYMTSSGTMPTLAGKYDLDEMPRFLDKPKTWHLAECMRINIRCADATLIFRTHDTPLVDAAIGYCHTGNWSPITELVGPSKKPIHVIREFDLANKKTAVAFLLDHNVKILNVGGQRSSKSYPHWEQTIYVFLVTVIQSAKFHHAKRVQRTLQESQSAAPHESGSQTRDQEAHHSDENCERDEGPCWSSLYSYDQKPTNWQNGRWRAQAFERKID